MITKNPKYRKQLSELQLDIFILGYKFRFIIVDLVAEYFGKNRSTIYERMHVLEQQGYLTKVYDGSYKLLGKPASYCLSSTAITLLKNSGKDLDKNSLQNMYKNKRLFSNGSYIKHCHDVMKLQMSLRRQYGKTFEIYTRFEIADYDWFPKPKPDLFLNRNRHSETKPNSYLLVLIPDNTDFYVRRKRVKSMVEHSDTGEWEPEGAYPSFLFVAINKSIQKKLNSEIKYNYDRFYIDEDVIKSLTTTYDELINSESKKDKIWVDVMESDEDGTMLASL